MHYRSEEAPDVLGESSSSAEEAFRPLLDSALFRKAPVQRKLLFYLWEHRFCAPSEYAIGLDVFGRKPDFDPKIDSTVRVQVSRLRQRLKEYYEQEGAQEVRRIVIPPGEYRVDVHDAPLPQPQPPAADASKPQVPRWILAMVAAQTVALVLLGWYILLHPASSVPPSLHPFWTPFAKAGKAMPIIVPAPQFFRWENLPIAIRDFNVGNASQLESSPLLLELRKKYGPPQTLQWYTVATDTLAAASVARFLQDRGVPANVLDSPAASLELLSTQDAIIFVGPGTASQLSPLTDTNFYLMPSVRGVTNRKPLPGEPAFFADVAHAPLRSTSHGVLARLPGKGTGTRVLIFASSHNPALASVVTTPSELDSLADFHREHGSSEFFEIVIRYERNADHVLEAKPVAFRAVTSR